MVRGRIWIYIGVFGEVRRVDVIPRLRSLSVCTYLVDGDDNDDDDDD